MIGAMQSALVGVRNMERALALFRDVLKLTVEHDGPASASLIAAWGLPAGSAARVVELSHEGYPIGRLRLAQFDPQPKAYVRLDDGGGDGPQDVGPKAVDFYVADPIGPMVTAVERAGYVFRSLPIKHQIGQSISEECLFSGPDGVPILLMVGHQHPAHSLRRQPPPGVASEIATVSAIAGDLDATRAFYEGGLGLKAVTDAETPPDYRDLVSKLVGVPAGSRVHFLLYAAEGEPSGKILLVHFFERTGKRLTGRMRPGHLGFSLLIHETDDLDGLMRWCTDNGHDVVTPPTDVDDLDGAKRMALVRGPNEEMFQFTERQ